MRKSAARLFLEVLEDRTVLSFAAPVAFDLGAVPNAVAVGHLEGASAPPDVVTANANGTLSVLLGKGDGTIQNPISLFVGGTPEAVAVGDFLGNGLQDIVAANADGTVSVLLSNGNDTFQAPSRLLMGATPVGVAVGDFNGDGKLDIVTANSNGTVTVLPVNGNGTFQSGIISQVGGILTSVAVGDFNGDGKPDLAVGTSTGLDSLVGNGHGAFQLKQAISFARTIHGIVFQEAVSSVAAVGNLQGNGKASLVVLAGSAVSVLLGNGDGTFQNPVQQNAGEFGVAAFVVGDFNGDGKPDIVTSNNAPYSGGGPSLSFLAGKGDGTFQAAQTSNLGETANALAAGDFRGNGKLDLVAASGQGSGTATLLPGNGAGSFAVVPSYAANVLPTSIAAGDFTGDGRPDLAVAGDGGLAVLLNNGNGTFRAGPTFALNGVATAVVVGDFNGDGKQDIAVSEGTGLDIFLGNGNGTFQAPKVFTLPNNEIITSMVVGNFVHGGLPDLAVTIFQTGDVMVLLNHGNGTFVRGQTINLGTDADGLATGDFNGDGKVDLVATSFLPDGTRDVKVLLGNGNGTFRAPIATTTGFSARFVSVGDFNGDGKPDLVLLDYFNVDNSVVILSGNGDGTFHRTSVIKFSAPLGFTAPAVGDFFGDGKLSFAVPTRLGAVTVLRGNGDGTFQAPVNYLTDFNGSQPNGMVVADFNGDGKPGLAVTNFLSDDVSVLLNNSPTPSHAAPVTTVTSLTTSANPAVAGQPVMLTATVTSSNGVPTGTVTFFDGNTMLGEVALDPNGQARLLVQEHAGSHSLRAVFAGIAPFTGSASAVVSETVHQDATITTLTADHVGGSLFVLTATVLPAAPGSGVPTGTVTFRDGNTILGTVSLNGGGALYVRLASGRHSLTVSYSGDDDFLASISATLVLNV